METSRNHKYTEAENEYIRQHYPDGDTIEIAKHLGLRYNSVRHHARSLGLHKSHAYKAAQMKRCSRTQASIDCRFKPGQEPMNKGRRRSDFVSKEGEAKCRLTEFKPGHKPHNIKPIGYESVNCEGYVKIKVADGRPLVFKHVWVWEQHHGKRPAGMIVAFRDGNKLNCDISNLMLITRSENARRMYENMTAEQQERRLLKSMATRNEAIRKDKMRIRWGLEPKTRLVKRWYAPGT